MAVLFGGMLLAYLWVGIPGGAGFALGFCCAWLVVGLGSGYWFGADAVIEQMIPELVRWRRNSKQD